MRSILLLFLLSSCIVVSGQEVEFKTTISSDSILLGNYFIYKIEINHDVDNISTPSFDGFQVISGPNVSLAMQIINEKSSTTKSYTYYLKPLDVGQYFIEPQSVTIDDVTYNTEPVEINVYHNPEGIIEEPTLHDENDFFNFSFPSFPDGMEMPKQEEKKKSKRPLKKI